ncbi:MAG: glycyl-radical enzyme activating protein [Lachnospiraceae bacterium]|nr:glycyl-radical enzyme activating protein [Lachnospiraceae bacterium]
MKDSEVKGRIFDIQRYSIHDGLGIRTIVFLKGCVLRCKWCCNPESQSHEIETMTVLGEEKTVGRDVTVAEVLEVAEKDRQYYRRSGGGITLSGGETLLQPEFALALLREAKHRGFNTAIESMGCAKYETIESLLPYIDTYLYDIKHTDPAKHERFTGKRNELMLENARKIAESGLTRLVIRVPVIPTFNETADEIGDIAGFADKLPGVDTIHLLPYHKFGEGKYEGLKRPYPMGDIPTLSNEHMQMLKKRVESVSKLKCHIGG